MEGQIGIVRDMGTQTSIAKPTAEAEGGVAVAVDTLPAATTPNDSGDTKPAQNQNKEAELKSKEEKLTPEEIEKGLDKIWDSLESDPEKKRIFKQHLTDLLLEHDVDNEKGEKLVETSAELLRFMKLMLALLIMFITNPKDVYSGEDFGLSETPPEGDEGYDLPSNAKDSRNSWKNIREGIQKIKQPLPFGEFMELVLKINAENPVKKFKIKTKETRQEALLKKLVKQKLLGDVVKATGRNITRPQHRGG